MRRFTKGRLYSNGAAHRLIVKASADEITFAYPITMREEAVSRAEFEAWFDKGGPKGPQRRPGTYDPNEKVKRRAAPEPAEPSEA